MDATQDELLKNTSALYTKAQAEMGEYKKARMAQIEQEANTLATEMAKNILKTDLTVSQHEKIVLDLIDEHAQQTKQ